MLLTIIFLLISTVIFAEVSDKVPTVQGLAIFALIYGVLTMIVSWLWKRVGLFLIPITLFVIGSNYDLIGGPIGEALVYEQREQYIVVTYLSILSVSMFHVFGLLKGFQKTFSRNRKVN